MNQTASDYQQIPPQNSQQLSRANVCGIFLTLQICQLTQPYGSLLFPGLNGLFWRCNPIASFVEACIITTKFVSTTWNYLRGKTRSGRPCSGLKGLIYEFGETASALLLIRSGDTSYQHAAGLYKSEESAPLVGQEASGADEPNPGVLRRRTTELEANMPAQTGSTKTGDTRIEKPKTQRQTSASKVLAHREWRIDVVTMLSVLLICIKIFAVQGAPILFATALAMTLGWLNVQILLLVFHSREMGDETVEASRAAARILHDEIEYFLPLFHAVFFLLHVPFAGYASFKFAWNLSLSTLVEISYLLFMLIACGAVLGYVASPAIHHVAKAIGQRAFRRKLSAEGTDQIMMVIGALAALVPFRAPIGRLALQLFQPYVEDALTGSYVTDMISGVTFLVHAALIPLTFALLLTPIVVPLGSNMKDDPSRYQIFTGCNVIFTLSISFFYLLSYSPEGTFKPAWTEWLG